jgi:muramoyltetrapeptide carboxypeptidase
VVTRPDPAEAVQPLTMPPLLRPGDKVAVVAPSGPVRGDRLDRGLAWLRSCGLEPVEAPGLRHRGGHGLAFVSGDDDTRLSDLVGAWCDPGVRAVLCARGGDGAPRLIERLPLTRLAAAGPRVFAGLSDITTLHQALAAGLGLATLWSPMPATPVLAGAEPGAAGEPWSRRRLLDALLDKPSASEAVLTGETLIGGGAVEAPLVGGTVSLLAAMAGTPGALPASGAVAVLEDVNEEPYRLERFLTQLRRSGFFAGVLGVACGDFVGCGDPAPLRRVLQDRLGDLGVPVVVGLPFGHGPRQASLWLGRPAALDAGRATLRQSRPA